MHLPTLVRHSATIAGMLSLLVAGSASATRFVRQEFTCPIGGEVFEASVLASTTTWGERPDGKPYGMLNGFPVVECPGNGFSIFKEEFTPEEIAILTPLIGSPSFQAMRESETPHYRVGWLMRTLGRPPAELANALLVASWESDGQPERKARYQREFVAATAKVPRSARDLWFGLNLRAANALRELRQFAEARNLLTEIQASGLWPKDEDQVEGARYLIDGLTLLIAEGNAYPEPTNLIPADIAVDRCSDQSAALSASEQIACASSPALAAKQNRLEYEQRQRDSDGEIGASSEADDADAEANQEAANAAADAAAAVMEVSTLRN